MKLARFVRSHSVRAAAAGLMVLVIAAAGLTAAGLTAAGPKDPGAERTGPVRLGIAGLSHDHVYGLLSRAAKGDVEIVGIAEPNAALRSRIAGRFGLPEAIFEADLVRMLDAAKPEAVAAFGPISDHVRAVRACAPRGIHVMVEKPLAFDLGEALEMEGLAVRHGIHLLTNYETTWYPSVHAAHRIVVGEGAVGPIRKVVVHDGHEGPAEIGVTPEFLDWLTDPARNGGGAIVDFGCYGANLVTWLFGGRAPLTVTAVTQRIKPETYPNVDDEATLVLTYPAAQAVIQASWNWPAGRKDIEIYGRTGAVLAPDRNTLRVRTKASDGERTETPGPLAGPFDDPFSYLAAVVRGRIAVSDEDLSSLANGVTVARILDAARESAAAGRTVRLDGAPDSAPESGGPGGGAR
jgi:predicted dehydrogenase